METDMSDKILNWVEMRLEESRVLVEELDHEGPIVFKDESIALNHATYQKDLWKLSLQHVNVKGKQVIEKWGSKIEIKNVNPSDAMELH
jgi:hypothetical protein